MSVALHSKCVAALVAVPLNVRLNVETLTAMQTVTYILIIICWNETT